MARPLRLMAIMAHPDDEALGNGGMLARYAEEGIRISLLTATRGERGWPGDPQAYPGLEALGRQREDELLDAVGVLSIRYVDFLGYIDGELDQAHPAEAIGKIVGHIRHVRPDVVVTFGPDGIYGHPDHIAISQFATAAVIEAANAASPYYQSLPAHRVAKFYYMVATQGLLDAYQAVFGDMVMHIDEQPRSGVAWPEWAVTTKINIAGYWPTALQAIACHRTQLPLYATLEHKLALLSEEQRQELCHVQRYYRVFSQVNGGRHVEDDLFEGLR
ncbi:1D-myo-inositol 2-acetamido-2-deoxy-alpha-D-glucopyranoside deacetylase [Dictyobacter alpinus]|uniref:1D-myo-inositol 2-acetamido-2-deoxy-alpha-D-glucopyranoside deacetylase n=1 Tax=Dictyobacter alpinus TaxID=2014873 RepID=A0A402BG59_9CHLR|nr:PIG-L family deacetylase [Dictyobacter alpinus]GCE30374.1 1D-myo-inositol 2-acetamido-2-deoxy-alpha-D-glucopyranoside deacetylase [Dictyobacter alpinus]